MVKPIPQVGAREIALSRGYMVHVFADGEAFLVIELQSQGVEKFYRTSAMSMLAYGVISLKVSGAQVMEQGNDAATFVKKFGCRCPHFPIYPQRVVCQPALIVMMVVAVGNEIVAMLQIGYDIVHPFAVDVAE